METTGSIRVTARGADTLPIDVLIEFQGDIKDLSDKNLQRLRSSILRHGFSAPIFVWESGGDYYILDGHQRLKALCSLRQEGYDIPLLPVDYIEAESETDAKEKLLHITSQYGEFNLRGLDLFLTDAGLSVHDLPDIRLTDTELSIHPDDEDTDEEPDYNDDEASYQEQYGVIVICNDEAEQETVYTRLLDEGYEVKVVKT